jgi:hypothetical protein
LGMYWPGCALLGDCGGYCAHQPVQEQAIVSRARTSEASACALRPQPQTVTGGVSNLSLYAWFSRRFGGQNPHGNSAHFAAKSLSCATAYMGVY